MTLEEVADGLDGYGADLARAFLSEPSEMSEPDADALFRWLVLEAHADVEDARQAYSEASDLMAECGLPVDAGGLDIQLAAVAGGLGALRELVHIVGRMLSPIELETLRAAANRNDFVRAWRGATLKRLGFLGLVTDSIEPTPIGSMVVRFLEAEAEAAAEGEAQDG